MCLSQDVSNLGELSMSDNENDSVSPDSILDECAACGDVIEIDDLVQCDNCGQVYCRECVGEHTCTGTESEVE